MNVRHSSLPLALALALAPIAPAHSAAGTAQLDPLNPTANAGLKADESAYLPATAGPDSVIFATYVDPNQAGPSDVVAGYVHDDGTTTYARTRTDGSHHLLLPAAGAAVVTVLLFKGFGADGKPDGAAASCAIGSSRMVPGTDGLANVPARGIAIERGASAYVRGAGAKGLVDLQTRGTDPADTHVLLDGRSDGIETLAASDTSVRAQLDDGVPLGRHRLTVRSRGSDSNELQSDVVTLRADPLAPSTTGSVQRVTVHVEGLPPDDAATVTFAVGGAAQLASDAPTQVVPLEDGIAQVDIRGVHAGLALVHFHLSVQLAQETPPASPLVETTPSPPPVTPKPQRTHGHLETPGPSDTPTYYPPPVQPHRPATPVPCSYRAFGIAFEPTQGSWQDDPVFRPRPLELRQYSSPGEQPRFDAPLPMVADRVTVLFGVEHYLTKAGAEVDLNARHSIDFTVVTNCTLPDSVYIHFRAFESLKTVWESDTGTLATIPLHGPAGATQTIPVGLFVPRGYPRPPSPLVFPYLGYETAYGIIAELLKDGGAPTGGSITVTGRVKRTRGPSVHIVPIILVRPTKDAYFLELHRRLAETARALADDVGRYVPDYFPLPPGGTDGAGSLPTTSEQVLDFSGAGIASAGKPNDLLLARLVDTVQTREMLAGAGRVVALFDEHDFALMTNPEEAAAYTATQKLIVAQPSNTYLTIAHELVHTLPWDWHYDATRPVDDEWYVKWMVDECGREYHNQDAPSPYGLHYLDVGKDHGPRIEFVDPTTLIMGRVSRNPEFTLCDFNHLVNQLQAVPDPPMLLVRGILTHAAGADSVKLSPFYTLGGVADLAAGSGGSWQIVVHDTNGAHVYGFEPRLNVPDLPHALASAAINERIPEPAGAARVELLGPSGILASVTLAARPPALRIVAPADGETVSARGGAIDVRWSGRAYDSIRPLVASVLYSRDGGKTFVPQAFETSAESVRVVLGAGGPIRAVKVVVTDGTRSSERIVRFRAR